jgi:hypothetical protein
MSRSLIPLGLLLGACALGCEGSRTAATPPAPSAKSAPTNAAPLSTATATAPAPTTDGWENLLPPANLAGFERVPIDPLANKSVWQVRPEGSLFIDGVGAKEMLLTRREFGDGSLHVEWRFLPPEPGMPANATPVYNGGVYVRTALDGKSWVQLQVARADKPPVVGDIIAQVPGHAARVDVFQTQPSAAAPIGAWNTYDVSLHGPTIELNVNGKPAATWSACPISSGHLGLQAEGSPIEVRAFRYRPL